MAEFSGFVLTNKGRELLAKAVAGETLTFTKISFGDGLYEGDKKEIEELAGLKNTFFINQIKRTGAGQVSLRAVITNRAVETGYHIREIGIYAVCGSEEEVLYAYNAAVEADYLPPFNGNNLIELEYQNYIVIDQAENVTAVIDTSATYLTKEEAEEIYVPQTQVAGEKANGIISLEDIRKSEAEAVLGGKYAGVFSNELKNVIEGKVYYLWNGVEKIYIPYLCLKTFSNTNGIAVPDGNFVNISNKNFNDRIKSYTKDRWHIIQVDNIVTMGATLDCPVSLGYQAANAPSEYNGTVKLPIPLYYATITASLGWDIVGYAEHLSTVSIRESPAEYAYFTLLSPVNITKQIMSFYVTGRLRN